MRFYDVEQGEILIDDKPIKNYNLDSLRAAFGLVSQEPYLFNESIKYNIVYNKYDATDVQVREAAIKSNAIKFIEKDEKLDVVVEDGKVGFERSVGIKGSN